MLGLARGAVYVYKSPQRFTSENLRQRMAVASLLFGLISLASVAIHLGVPLVFGFAHPRLTVLASIAIAFPIPVVLPVTMMTLFSNRISNRF